MGIKPKNAVDLGCGAGRDTIYLIKNGWNVLAIDRENTKEIISRIKMVQQNCRNGYKIVSRTSNKRVYISTNKISYKKTAISYKKCNKQMFII